jgi:DNA-binding transcriptional LysR family regulator
MLPDFNRLKVFYFIYLCGSITAAAGKMHISPSAVSQQLRKLEEEMGTKLFTRPHKRMIPTSSGTLLFAVVQPFIKALETTVGDLNRAKHIPSGLLKVGSPVEFGKMVLPKFIASYRKRFPEVTFYLQIGRTSELLPLLRAGKLDFAFVDSFPAKDDRLNYEMSGFSLLPVFNEIVVLACSGRYYEEQLKGDHSFAALSRQKFVAQQVDARAIQRWFHHNYGKYCQNLQVVFTVANHQAVINGIRQHMGLGIIVSQLVKEDIRRGDIIAIETSAPHTINTVSLIQLMEKVPTITEKSFQTHIFRALSPNAPQGGIN